MFIRRVSLLLAPVTFYASSASRSVNVHFYKLLFTTKERTFFASLENILNVKYPCETINYSSEDFVLKNREKLVSDLTLPRNRNKKKKNKKREEKGSFIHSSFHLYDPTLDNKILEIIRRTKNHLQPLLDRKCVEWWSTGDWNLRPVYTKPPPYACARPSCRVRRSIQSPGIKIFTEIVLPVY